MLQGDKYRTEQPANLTLAEKTHDTLAPHRPRVGGTVTERYSAAPGQRTVPTGPVSVE